MSTEPLPKELKAPPSKGFHRLSKLFRGGEPASNSPEVPNSDSKRPVGGESSGKPTGSKAKSKDRISDTKTSTHSWSNWAGTQSQNPARIFHPETIENLIEIIQQAKTEDKKVRCAGSGYTWASSSVVQDEGFLVIMNKMDKIYDPVHLEGDVWTVEVETGVQIKSLDDFLRNHDPPLTLPTNTTTETARFGGVLSLGCHGAGLQSRTFPDIAHSVKIVDASGKLNIFSKDVDPVEFSAAILSLGLLGIVYTYKLRVVPMFKLQVTDTYHISRDFLSVPERDGPKLKALVESNYQTVIIYVPFNKKGPDASNDVVWTKSWKRTTDLPLTETAKQTKSRKRQQRTSMIIANKLYKFMITHPRYTQSMSRMIFSAALSPSNKVLYAPDAMHFVGGVDDMKCLVLGMGIKVNANYENVVKAWNYVINETYEHAHRGEFPLTMARTLRIRIRKNHKGSKPLKNVPSSSPASICPRTMCTETGESTSGEA